MRNLTRADLSALWPRAKAELIDGILDSQVQLFRKYDIVKALRLAHLMAQLSHESGGGVITEESLYYTTAKRLCEAWPTRFESAHDAAPYLRNPEKLANHVYNGRMGNQNGSDDGWKFRGRGLIQTTGRAGYRALGIVCKVDLEAHPKLLNAPDRAFEFAVAEFASYHGMMSFCDKDDLRSVTRLINGGYNGLEERRVWLQRWKRQLGMVS